MFSPVLVVAISILCLILMAQIEIVNKMSFAENIEILLRRDLLLGIRTFNVVVY